MNKSAIKRLLSIIILTGIVLYGHAQDVQTSYRYNLEECINYALEHNQDLLNKAYEKDIANTQVGETLSRGLPQVNINSGLNYNYELQKSLLPASIFDPNAPEDLELQFAFGQKYDGNIILTARQLIFDGSFFVGLQAARTYRELSSKDYIKTRIDVVEAVSKAYYTQLVTYERLKLLEANFSRLDSLLIDTETMHENGFVEKIDLSKLQVQLNNLKVQLENTKKLATLSNDLLKFQMGMPLSNVLELADKIENIDLGSSENKVENFEYNKRIEYSQLQTNLALVNLDMKNNRVQYIPTLYANFNYGYNTQAGRSSQLFESGRWLNFGALGLSLSIPVFDGFLKRNKIQRNKIQIAQIEHSFDMLENSIDLEIKKAIIDMTNSREQMQVQKENMELAEEVYNVSKIKYEEGIGSNSEVLDADKALKESQTNYYNALFDALIAKIELEKAYGILLKK